MKNNNATLKMPKCRFPEFLNAGAWEVKTLGEIAVLITEKTGKKSYTLLSVTAGVGLVSQIEKFGKEIAGEAYKNYFVIQKEDFAYNKSSTKQHPEGQIALLENFEQGAVPNSIFTCFRVHKRASYPYFLKHLFETNIHGKWLHQFIAVGARANGALQVESKALFRLPIPLPSLAEQQKIATCLSSLDEWIAAQTEQVAALQLHKKGLLQQLFPAAGETIPRLRFPEFEEDWISAKLKKICEMNPSSKGLPNQFIYIDLESVSDGLLLKENEINREGAPSRAQRLLQKHDILFQMVRPYQKNNLYFDKVGDYVASTGYAQLRTNQDPQFIYQYLHTQPFVDKVIEKCTGTGYPAINSSDLSEIMINYPSKAEQQQIAACLSAIDARIAAETEQLAALKTHKKGLMQQLFPST